MRAYLHFFCFFVIGFAVLGGSFPVYAQDVQGNKGDDILQRFGEALSEKAQEEKRPPKEMFRSDSDLIDIPTEYIDEAMAFKDKCSADADMVRYYNCECLSVKYLDQRIARGPEATEETIQISLERECKDATFAAASVYSQCVADRIRPPEGRSLEKFCQCVGSMYGKIYEQTGVKINSSMNVEMRTHAIIACRNPSVARRLYSFTPVE